VESEVSKNWTTIDYLALRQVMKDTRARQQIVILDCCYSGLAGTLADPATDLRAMLPSKYDRTGTFLLAATGKTELAQAPLGEDFTSFTGQLLHILKHGIDGRGPLLDMQTIFRQLLNIMRERGLPEPEPYTQGDAGLITMARNRAYIEGAADPGEIVDERSPALSGSARRPPNGATKQLTHVLTLRSNSDLEVPGSPFRAVAFGDIGDLHNRKAMVAAVGDDTRLSMWRRDTGKLTRSYELSGPSNALAITDDRIYCGGSAKCADELRLDQKPDKGTTLSFLTTDYEITAMLAWETRSPLSESETVITAGDGGVIQAWRVETERLYGDKDRDSVKLKRSWSSLDDRVYSLALVSYGVISSVGSAGIPRLWDSSSGELKMSFDGCVDELWAVATGVRLRSGCVLACGVTPDLGGACRAWWSRIATDGSPGRWSRCVAAAGAVAWRVPGTREGRLRFPCDTPGRLRDKRV